ncbi:MAG: ATP-grasp domain-containing protein [Lachnospiraceae bacterium]|nr:ATP-grasp domain-containing protein [Lachnospiraceae bacterium]
MKELTVLITGVGGGGVGEQVLKCLKMSKLQTRIIGCDMNRTSKGLGVVDKAYIVPASSSDQYLDCIRRICKTNGVDIIFPGSEPELKVLSENRDLFEENGICLPFNSRKLISICMDKNKTMEFLRSNSIPVQKTWEIHDESGLDQIDIFPVVLKPSIGGGGSVNTFIAQDKRELKMFGTYLLDLYSVFTVQEYVGNAESEYTVGVMCGKDGRYINSIAVKKSILSGLSNRIKVPNKTGRSELGKVLAISSGISQGMIGRFPEVTVIAKRIAEKLGATAPINIQGRIHNGEFYVFEINPRISGTSPLRAIVGYNEPEMVIRDRVFGEEIESDFEYKEGVIVRGLDETFISNEFMNAIESV